MAGSQHARDEAVAGSQPLEQGGRRVELLDRGRRAHVGGPLGEQHLLGGEVVDVGAVVGPGRLQLAPEVACSAAKPSGGGGSGADTATPESAT